MIGPREATRVDLADTRFTPLPVARSPSGVLRLRAGVDLPSGPPTPVPWSEFEGGYEAGSPRFLHVGDQTYANRTDGYLREVAVWPTGVLWFQDDGLRFLSTDRTAPARAVGRPGTKTTIRGVPAWYGRLAFGPDTLYFLKRGVLVSLSADLTRHRGIDIDDLLETEGVDSSADAQEVRATLLGLLSPDDPLLRLRYRVDDDVIYRLYSPEHGVIPLRARWEYVASPSSTILVGIDPTNRTVAAYDSRTFRPLWTHTFSRNGRPVRVFLPRFTPGGGKVVLAAEDERGSEQTIILHASSGRVETRLDHVGEFEDDSHFVLPIYDGPPNPFFDPTDSFPEVSEIDYENVLIRCSLRGECAVVARVPGPERSLITGSTYLFPSRS